MFATLFKSFFKKSNKNVQKQDLNTDMVMINRQDVEEMLTQLNENEDYLDNGDIQSVSSDNIVETLDSLSIADTHLDYVIDNDSTIQNDKAKSEISSIEKNFQEAAKVEDPIVQKTINQINSLQCPFTWNIKPSKHKNLVSLVQNKYGEYNLDISSPEFTFERYLGNLIIGYELFHKDNPESGQMKILEIGKWLEELDNSTDAFYLSINVGLKHVMTATFIHMLFATNLIGECKWLLNDISSFANMDNRSRASAHALHAALLTEYGGNALNFKKACEYAKKACDLDPKNAHWFYIYSLALTAQRHFLHSIKSNPSENEIIAIQQAIGLSDGRNTFYNYHRMTLDKDITIYDYHNNINKKDKSMMEKNFQENKTIVQMIRTIVSMEPKDPHIVIKCARTLMTLPAKVRDFKLGVQYLEKALRMAPNDPSVLRAVTRAAELFREASKNTKNQKIETEQNPLQFKQNPNKTSKLGEDLAQIVKKHANGKDALPYLTDLLNNNTYNSNEKCKILAQICSYTLLFKNNLKSSIEWFITLIEQPEIEKNDYLIKRHFSSFGSKKFDLAELICNEIRLAINSSGTVAEDMLFYCKMLTKIMEKCNLNIKDVDSSMKNQLIVDISATHTCSNTTNQNEIDSSDESVDQSLPKTSKRKNKNIAKHLKNTGPRIFTENTHKINPESNQGPHKKNNQSPKKVPHKNIPKNSQSKTDQSNTSNINQMKSKMSKFLVQSDLMSKVSTNSNPLSIENIRHIQSQAEIDNYTRQLYQNILQQNILQPQHHLQNDRVSNQSSSNLNTLFQNPQPPPLLSLRPQVDLQNVKPKLQKAKKTFNKKK